MGYMATPQNCLYMHTYFKAPFNVVVFTTLPTRQNSSIKTTKPCHPLVNTRKRELNLKQRKNKTRQRVKKGDRK